MGVRDGQGNECYMYVNNVIIQTAMEAGPYLHVEVKLTYMYSNSTYLFILEQNSLSSYILPG